MSQNDETPGTTVNQGAETVFGLLSDDPEFREIEEEAGDDSPEEGLSPADELEPEGETEEPEDVEPDAGEPDTEDDDSDADEPSDEDPPQTFEVKVDGETLEVSLDEALAGYQRQEAFTRKTQEIAEQRRTLQERAEQVRTEREQYQQRLQAVEQALQVTLPEEPDWETLREEDPEEFADTFAAYQNRVRQVQAVQSEQARVAQEAQAEAQAERERRLEVEREKLVAAVPEWTDEDTFQAEQQDLVEYAQNTYGFTPEELGQVVDHRAIVMLRKARLYDQLSEKGEEAKAQAKKKKSPTLKPGSSKSKKQKKQKRSSARDRLKKTGSMHDGAESIFEILEQD